MKQFLFIQKTIMMLAVLLTISSTAYADLNWNAGSTQTLANGTIINENINIIGTGTVTIVVNSGTAIIYGIISGDYGSIEKKGAGMLILAGINTYGTMIWFELKAPTKITEGSLQIGYHREYGCVLGNIINNSNLILNFVQDFPTGQMGTGEERNYSGIISGTGNVYVDEDGVYFLDDNTYKGNTFISNAILHLGNGGTKGSIVGNVVLDGGDGYDDYAYLIFDRSNVYIFEGNISGGGGYQGSPGVFKRGTGHLIFTGKHTYTHDTQIDDGFLQIGYHREYGCVPGNIINNSNLILNFVQDAPVSMGGTGDERNYSGIISGTGNVYVDEDAVCFLNDNTYTGNTFIYNAVVYLGNGGTKGSIVGNVDLVADDVDDYAGLVFNRSNDYIFEGDISGGGGYHGAPGVAKRGAGTLTLTGNHTNNSTFKIEAGTVKFSGSWAGGFHKSNGANLEIIKNITVGKNLILEGGNIFMDLTTTPPSKISVTGAVNASGINALSITSGSVTNAVLIEAASGIENTTPYALNIPGMTGTISVNAPTQLLLTATNGINEGTISDITVYPNPTTGELRIETGDMSYEIYDVFGRNVSNLKSQISNQIIDISRFPAGIYFLRIQTEQGVITKKVVKD